MDIFPVPELDEKLAPLLVPGEQVLAVQDNVGLYLGYVARRRSEPVHSPS